LSNAGVLKARGTFWGQDGVEILGAPDGKPDREDRRIKWRRAGDAPLTFSP